MNYSTVFTLVLFTLSLILYLRDKKLSKKKQEEMNRLDEDDDQSTSSKYYIKDANELDLD